MKTIRKNTALRTSEASEYRFEFSLVRGAGAGQITFTAGARAFFKHETVTFETNHILEVATELIGHEWQIRLDDNHCSCVLQCLVAVAHFVHVLRNDARN